VGGRRLEHITEKNTTEHIGAAFLQKSSQKLRFSRDVAYILSILHVTMQSCLCGSLRLDDSG